MGLIIAVVLLVGCAPSQSVLRYEPEQPFTAVWPQAPEVPRYRYVGELTGVQNIRVLNNGVASAGTRFFKWLVGLTSPKHIPTVLQRPFAGVADEAGRVYVTDVSRQSVYVYDEAAGELHVCEMATSDARFVTPIGIALGAHNEILVADAQLGSVVRLDRQGKPLGEFGKGQLVRPAGVARAPGRGRIYVADTHAHDNKENNKQNKQHKTNNKHNKTPRKNNKPTQLSFADDKLYVTDTLNARIQILTADGKSEHVFGHRGVFVGDMPRPKGVGVDKD